MINLDIFLTSNLDIQNYVKQEILFLIYLPSQPHGALPNQRININSFRIPSAPCTWLLCVKRVKHLNRCEGRKLGRISFLLKVEEDWAGWQYRMAQEKRDSVCCDIQTGFWTAERSDTVSLVLLPDCSDYVTAFNMEPRDSGVGLSTAAVVAIVCNVLVAVLLLVLFLILYKACKVPSSQERVPVLAPGNTQQKNEQKYLLTSWALAWTQEWARFGEDGRSTETEVST